MKENLKLLFYICVIPAVFVLLSIPISNLIGPNRFFFLLPWLVPVFFLLKKHLLKEDLDSEAFDATMFSFTLYGLTAFLNWYMWLIMPASVLLMYLIMRKVYENKIIYNKMLAEIKSKRFDDLLDKTLQEIGVSSEYKKDVKNHIILVLGAKCDTKELARSTLKDVVSEGVELWKKWGDKTKR